ncbi:MAG: Rrf2 family transcriptional regulator [Candidatus Dadabacteria bacterium]|nr:MAG: Rrf2 family transcriptional regulator [Candidatus Dadabacteria bacterium]
MKNYCIQHNFCHTIHTMRVTKWGEYGILCSLYLAKRYTSDEAITGATDISRVQLIPLQYTQQILQRLRKGGIIKSVRGPHGGYLLSRAPEEISLFDILKAAEGDTFEVICDHEAVYPEHCASASCSLKPIWYELKEQINSFLEKKSLAEMLKSHSLFPGEMNNDSNPEKIEQASSSQLDVIAD